MRRRRPRPILFQKAGDKRHMLILEQTDVQKVVRSKEDFIYTKSPVDVVVAVKTKYDEIKCV